MKRTLLIASILLLNLSYVFCQVDEGRNFIYFFNNSVVYANNVEKVSPFLGNTYFKADSLKFEPGEVKFYKNEIGFYANIDKISHYSIAKSFIPRTKEGKVNIFQKEVMTFSSDINHAIPSFSDNKAGYTTKDFYNKGYSDLKQVSYKNLLKDLSDNRGSMVHLKKYRQTVNKKIIFSVAGGAALVTGLVLLDNELHFISNGEEKPEPKVVPGMVTAGTGAALVFTGYLIGATRSNHLYRAIRKYNE